MKNKRHAFLGALGVAFVIAASIFILSGIKGRAGSSFEVTATFGRVGQLLRVSGDIKMRGVRIGKIAQIEHLPDGRAQVKLALDPGTQIPENVSATITAKTLFGEKFVQLLDPEHPSARFLRPGDHIPENRTIAPFELDQVIQKLVPILDATDPGDLGGALHALAVGLAGQEGEARHGIDESLVALAVLGDHKADLDRLLAGFDESSSALRETSPALVSSLNSLDRLSRELNADEPDVQAVLKDAPTVLDRVAALIEARYTDLVDISVKGADILDLVASHRNALPSTVAALKTFTQDWDTNLSIPCTNAAGQTIGQMYPSLKGTTCWQLWVVSAEQLKDPGGYTGDGPMPAPTTASINSAVYRAQVRQLLALPFGSDASDLDLLLLRALTDGHGLIPESLL